MTEEQNAATLDLIIGREITEEEITKMFEPAPVFAESFHWMVGWLQDKFPNGVKII